jgi:hypothetical protein
MTTDKFGNVETFMKAWMAKRIWRPPFENAIHTTDIAYALSVFRTGQYQVELYIIKPNTLTPVHSHPNIESISVYLTGNMEFRQADGTFADLSAYQTEKPNGTHRLQWMKADTNYGTPHAVKTGEEGGAFLIFEKWLVGTPTSVAVSWEGELVGEEHAKLMENR